MAGSYGYVRESRRRTTEQVLRDHLRRQQAGLIDEDIEQNYADDAVVLSEQGIHRGHRGVRRAARNLQKSLGEAYLEYRTRLVEGENAFVEWTAHLPDREVSDGVSSFVIRDGRIVAETIHFSRPPPQ